MVIGVVAAAFDANHVGYVGDVIARHERGRNHGAIIVTLASNARGLVWSVRPVAARGNQVIWLR